MKQVFGIRWIVVLVFMGLCMVSHGTGMSTRADDLPSMLFFYSLDCEHCTRIREEFLPGFLERYGKNFTFFSLEVSGKTNLDSLYAMEARVSVPEEDKDYPAVYFMGTMLEGEIPVVMTLERLMETYLANPDSLRAIDREVMARVPERVVTRDIQTDKIVHLAYFYKHGCSECSRAEEIIVWLKSRYPFLEIDQFDIGESESKIIATALGMRTGMPEERLMGTPVFFFGGSEYVLAEDISQKILAALAEKYAPLGTTQVWKNLTPGERARAQAVIREEFQSFVFFTVALAALADGINPCAFASILLFVSYLSMIGRKKNEILAVGLSFAFAVFLTYFLVGLGFLKFIQALTGIEIVAKVIFGGTAILCFVFGILSISDYFKVRHGKTADMSLQLPGFLKRRIHATIREKARTKSIIIGALIAGFLVSLLEFACTGQVYLPTIVYMTRIEGYQFRAVLYLLLYNVCFIVPLLAVFGIVYFGVSSRSVASVMESRVGMIKLLLALVFFLVAGLLLWVILV